MTMTPKPKTVALVGADAEFGINALEGARTHAKRLGLEIVYDQRYPPNTLEFGPVVRAIKATNPDLVFVGSYPPDSAGIVRAALEAKVNAPPPKGGGFGLRLKAGSIRLRRTQGGLK